MEKVKIPAWVAKKIRECSTKTNDINNRIYDAYLNDSSNRFDKWIRENPAEYVVAVTNDYEIEEELYYIKFCPCDSESYLNTRENIEDKTHWTANSNKEYEGFRIKFTMEEIENYLPQFKPFATKVEEDDEDESD